MRDELLPTLFNDEKSKQNPLVLNDFILFDLDPMMFENLFVF